MYSTKIDTKEHIKSQNTPAGSHPRENIHRPNEPAPRGSPISLSLLDDHPAIHIRTHHTSTATRDIRFAPLLRPTCPRSLRFTTTTVRSLSPSPPKTHPPPPSLQHLYNQHHQHQSHNSPPPLSRSTRTQIHTSSSIPIDPSHSHSLISSSSARDDSRRLLPRRRAQNNRRAIRGPCALLRRAALCNTRRHQNRRDEVARLHKGIRPSLRRRGL